MTSDKTTTKTTMTAAERKAVTLSKGSAPLTPLQTDIARSGASTVITKLKTIVRSFAQKYGQTTVRVLGIALLVAVIEKLRGVF